MSWRRGFFALIVGLVLAGGVWVWPATPLWKLPVGKLHGIMGFHPETQSLYLLKHMETPNDRPELYILNPRTGEIQKQVVFGDQQELNSSTWLSNNFQTIFFKANAGGKVSVFDAQTGRLINKALPGFETGRVSQDESQYWAYTMHVDAGLPGAGLSFFSYTSGAPLFAIKPSSRGDPEYAKFAGDSSTVVVFWRGEGKFTITLHELPTGKELRSYELPQKLWVPPKRWDGKNLWIEAYQESKSASNSAKMVWECFRFDLSQPALGEGEKEMRMRSEHIINESWTRVLELDGAIVHLTGYKNVPQLGPWYIRARDWVLDWMGKKRQDDQWRSNVVVVDSSNGKVTGAVSGINSPILQVSVKAGVVACITNDQYMEVWDLAPPAKWPWMLGLGLGGFGLVLLYGSWRARRRVQQGQA